MAIISTSDYKTWRGISASTWDTIIGVMIAAAQDEAETFCNRRFDSATYTEKTNGRGSETIVLANTPITSITSITWTSPDGSSSTYDSTTYAYDSTSGVVKFDPVSIGRLPRDAYGELADEWTDWGASSVFARGHQNITTVYVGGYTSQTMPASLKLAMYRYVDAIWGESPYVGSAPSSLQSESLGDYSYSNFANGGILTLQGRGMVTVAQAKLQSLFQPWRREAVA